MKQSRWFLAYLLILLCTGCSPAPQTPNGAIPVAQAFMQARAAHDSVTMYALLTAQAQQAIQRAKIATYIGDEHIRFDSLGSPIPRDNGWVQIPIHNLEVRHAEERVVWPEIYLTCRYDGRNWRIAWAEPLIADGYQHYENSAYVEEQTTGRTLVEIDPYQYRGYLEQHFAYRGLQEYRLAELWLSKAAQTAIPAQMPDVDDATARFKLSLNQAADAVAYARRALDRAAPYTPDTYSYRWKADTFVVLARALFAMGDRAGAEDAIRQAAEIDPQNGALATFRWQLLGGMR